MRWTTRVTAVCVVGPDGAGKTSIAVGLETRLIEQGYSVQRLQPRPKVIDKHTNPDFDYHNPHQHEPRNLSRSLLKVGAKFGYAWASAAQLRLTRSNDCRPDYTLEERGWMDHGVDNRRYRIHPTAGALVLRLWRFVPTPDKCILLTGDPATIAARKTELTTDEVRRQLDVWADLATRQKLGRSVLVLDTTSLTEAETTTASISFATQ
jgi:hypothetical protein